MNRLLARNILPKAAATSIKPPTSVTQVNARKVAVKAKDESPPSKSPSPQLGPVGVKRGPVPVPVPKKTSSVQPYSGVSKESKASDASKESNASNASDQSIVSRYRDKPLNEKYVKSINVIRNEEEPFPTDTQGDLYVFNITKKDNNFKWDWNLGQNPENNKKGLNYGAVNAYETKKFFTNFNTLENEENRKKLIEYYAKFFLGSFNNRNVNNIDGDLDVKIFIGKNKFRFYPQFVPQSGNADLLAKPLNINGEAYY